MDELPPREELEPQDDTKKGTLSFLLATKSVTERKTERVGKEIESLIKHPTAKDRQVTSRFQSAGGSSVKEYCRHGTKENCRAYRRSHTVCENVHFRAVIHPHTDKKLGDCSYLNACRHMKTCKFVHYEIDHDERRPRPRGRDGDEDEKTRQRMEEEDAAAIKKFLPASKQAIHFWPEMYNFPPQWICCDVRGFNLEVLGEFPIIMADPPWDIHMELPYGTLKDEEMLDLPIDKLAKAGVIFLWVTGRAMELGRKCLQRWGYDCVGEMLWVKTNQLQRLIRTGRTGHWLNHSKEHCLIGLKGDPPINHNIDCDVIVSEVRETSRKPDEIYGLLERLAPGARKLEIFGRQHNTRPGWVTLGNQLEGTALADPFIIEKWKALYPKEEFKLIPVAHLNQNSNTSSTSTNTETNSDSISSTNSSTMSTSVSPSLHSTQAGIAPPISSLS